jgi:hypothetical protein
LKNGAWRDEFTLDSQIWPNTAEEYGKPWRTWKALKRRLDVLNSKAFQASTHFFRDTYNHRFSLRFVIGLTPVFREQMADGRVCYKIGGQPPLDLNEALLLVEQDRCYQAFEAFQAMVRDHEAAIATNAGV